MDSTIAIAAGASTDLERPGAFVKRFPNIVSEGALRHQLNFSAANGLDAAGAVIRKHTRPDSKRPIIFINVPAYFRWLSSDARAA